VCVFTLYSVDRGEGVSKDREVKGFHLPQRLDAFSALNKHGLKIGYFRLMHRRRYTRRHVSLTLCDEISVVPVMCVLNVREYEKTKKKIKIGKKNRNFWITGFMCYTSTCIRLLHRIKTSLTTMFFYTKMCVFVIFYLYYVCIQ